MVAGGVGGGASAPPSRLRSTPGERSVLSMVLPAHVLPAVPQGRDLALLGVREGIPVRRRMARILQMDGLRRVGIEAHGGLGRDVDHPWRADGPPGGRAIEANRR